ncbi:hypothetical protein NP493_1127g02070 [Ridgeia piscesae]|uniref:Uncharacterized protein n=1 Tax=Ridgeia piscesae TaxID=27915 RepID=A0AAD9NKV6_RIDPI|nr:hypothetical protein NP493_1127g02070 [Ridgeia piscesae]
MHPLAPSRSQFNSHRNAASPKPVAILHLRYRHRKAACHHDHRRTSQIFRRQRHAFTHPPRPPRSPCTRIETRHRQSAIRTTSGIRRSETTSFKHPSIRCYRSNNRYQ